MSQWWRCAHSKDQIRDTLPAWIMNKRLSFLVAACRGRSLGQQEVASHTERWASIEPKKADQSKYGSIYFKTFMKGPVMGVVWWGYCDCCPGFRHSCQMFICWHLDGEFVFKAANDSWGKRLKRRHEQPELVLCHRQSSPESLVIQELMTWCLSSLREGVYLIWLPSFQSWVICTTHNDSKLKNKCVDKLHKKLAQSRSGRVIGQNSSDVASWWRLL